MQTVRFGIIGAGLMAREFASAAARWCHLIDPPARPEIVAVCDRNPASLTWFKTHFPTVTQYTSDYTELLANKQIDAVYAAVAYRFGATLVTLDREQHDRVAGFVHTRYPSEAWSEILARA